MEPLGFCRRHALNAALSVGLFGLVATGSFTFFRQPPSQAQEKLELKILTAVVRTGEPLQVETAGDRKMLCVVTLARRVHDIDQGVTVHKAFVPGGFYGLGPWRERVKIDLPALPDGLYGLTIQQNNDCGHEVFPLTFPMRTFRVSNQN